MGFPGGLTVKNPPVNAGDTGSIPGSGRSPGEENGNPLQYTCLENPMDRGAWWATVHGPQKSQTQLNNKNKSLSYRVKSEREKQISYNSCMWNLEKRYR